MLWRHSDVVASGQLFPLNDGAACSFDMSPEKTKTCAEAMVLSEDDGVALDEAGPAWRIRFQGTATNLSPAIEAVEPPRLELELLLAAIALESRLITAKSNWPEVGLKSTSSIVPMVCPWLFWTAAPMILEPRTAFW